MRTVKTALLAMLLLVSVSVTGWAQNNASKASILGSPHDFTNANYTFAAGATGTGTAAVTNTCFFCHVIHKTATNRSGVATTSSLAPGYLLWNHQLSSQSSYGVYSSDTFTAVLTAASVAAPTDLGNSNNITAPTTSNLCLSCHDGTIAIAQFYEAGFGLPANGSYWNNGHGNSLTMYTGMQVSDLTKSHPVNFIYNSALATAAGMKQPASLNSVDGNGAVPLYGNAGYLECTTCHDPHNGASIVSGTVFPFARLALMNAETAQTGGYCTYCHT
jgi:hypothetical protein